MGCKNTKHDIQKKIWQCGTFTAEYQLFTMVFALISLSLFRSSINISFLTYTTLFIFHFLKSNLFLSYSMFMISACLEFSFFHKIKSIFLIHCLTKWKFFLQLFKNIILLRLLLKWVVFSAFSTFRFRCSHPWLLISFKSLINSLQVIKWNKTKEKIHCNM